METIKEPKLLPSVLVERGEVNVYHLFERDGYSVAKLKLSPGAKIKRHRHTFDNEMYYFSSSEEVSICLSGEEHELENTSNEVLEVFSIKYPKG